MQRSLPFMVAALVVAAVAVPMAGMAAVGQPAPVADDAIAQTGTNTSNATVAPGERMSGVVGVQKAEVEGEVDRRAFGLQVASAATNESKAGVVAGQFDNIQQRLDALQQRKANLTEARQNGSISEGKYRAQVAELSARIDSAKQLANETAEESSGLPTELLEANGVNATAIQTLQERASELGGGEVAEIARQIGGAPEDRNTGDDRRPDDRGQDADRPEDDADTPAMAENTTEETADDAVNATTETVTSTTETADSSTEANDDDTDTTSTGTTTTATTNTTDGTVETTADGA